MSNNRIQKAVLLVGLIPVIFSFCTCSNEKWESFGSYGENEWPLSITNGVEKYEFDYEDNTAIHYFDEQNADKIWFRRFKDPQKDALKKRHVMKVQKHMVDGWTYSDETKGNQNWPWFIYKGTEKYVFDYSNNSVDHYFDPDNAEKIWFSSIQDPKNDVLNLQNVTKKVEKYIVDGWQYNGSYGDNNWPLSISKGNEKYEFDYQNNTVLHSWDDFQNAENIQFKVIQDPQKDALGKHNVSNITRLLVNGWSLEGSIGNKHWPQTMSKGNNTIKFDYQNKSATLFTNGKEVSKTWFSQFKDPANDYIKQNNVVYIKKAAENGWTYSGRYGKYEYPTSMSKGNEKYEFDYKNGFIAYHFVNGRRTEALEFSALRSPMDVINKRSDAKIREYEFDYQGKLYRVRYLSKLGNYYVPFDIGSEGREEIGSTSIYKKGTGWVDDVVIKASQQFNVLSVWFEGRVYNVYEIENGTGIEKKIAEVPQGQLKAYLLNILYGLEGSDDTTLSKQQNNDVSNNSTNENYQNNTNYNKTTSDIDDGSARQVASLWSQYHNDRDINRLSSLYANQVFYYQSSYTKEQIKSSKEKLLNKYPNFRQEISNVSVKNEPSYYAVYFDKKVWTDLQNAPKTYPSYLHVKMIDGSWKIITESDQVTDENLRKKNSQRNVSDNYVVIDGTDLRLRLGPSTSADTFKWGDGSNRHPNVGEKFKYLGESGDFYKIDYKGHELWVSKQYAHLE